MIDFLKIYLFLPLLFCIISCKQEPIQNQDTQATTPAVVDKTDIDYNSSQWTELTDKDSVTLDLRYATTNNFVKEKIYPCARCFLKPNVADALLLVNRSLIRQGYKLKLFDCYRPTPAQQVLWNKVPDSNYVAPPKKGRCIVEA